MVGFIFFLVAWLLFFYSVLLVVFVGLSEKSKSNFLAVACVDEGIADARDPPSML
jgi:hypothetical protein